MGKFNLSESALTEFLAECDEISQRLANGFEKLGEPTESPGLLDSIYRDMHSLKGSAQLFGFAELGNLAHVLESCLDPIRKGKALVSPEFVNELLRCLDLIDRMVISIRNKKDQSFKAELDILVPAVLKISTASVGGDLPVSNEFPKLAENLSASATPIAAVPNDMSEPIHSAEADKETKSANRAPEDSASTIRVPVALLDRLMTLMGEMVLVRNQVLQYSSRSDDLEFLNLSQRLNVVTSEIQGEMMKTRMQPIGNIMNKFNRVVRDLAKELNKKVDLNMVGTETELDKTLLEAVKDPLTHIIRNSCDHGIETPEERRKQNKPETGTILVRSYHEGGQVIVEVQDDGKGLHRDKLLAKAIEKGVVTQEKAGTLNDRDIMNLIFAPGFSTAAKVTNVSGRGVGMDVVRSNIDRIGGVVELSSEAGKGTTIRLKIPLTLAIVPAMIVRCDEDRYAIPQVKLVELVRVEKSNTANGIEFLQGKPVYRLRGNLLPLIDLKGVLKFPTKEGAPEHDVINIVVVNAERQLFGMIVDEILDTADIVVKPLNRFLKNLIIYSGATVLGDGSVALILDVMGIAQQQLLLSERKEAELDSTLNGHIKSEDAQEFLLFRLNSTAKHCILLSYVHRLEEFKLSAVELSGKQRVVRYRDSVLPILSLNECLGFGPAQTEERTDVLSIIVCQRGDLTYGLEVDEIIDVLSTERVMERGVSDRPGILGNLVTEQEIIVVVDPLRIISDVAVKFSHAAPPKAVPGQLPKVVSASRLPPTATPLKILFAEDMVFFRKQVAAMLEEAGYKVTAVKDGKEAMAKLEASAREEFDLILSDIEMPNMTGFQLAAAVRADEKWKSIPLVALTTRSDSRSVEEGLKAGFNAYLEKLNPDEMINAIEGVVSGARRAS